MAEQDLLLDILLILGAALFGAVTLRILRLPPILGFLAAGMAIGPGTPGPVGDVENVRRAADIGVVLLMFSIGIQFSFGHLVRNKRVILLGGGFQIVATVLLGFLLSNAMGLGPAEALIVGFFAANTSTVVATKVLSGTREDGSEHGAAAINVSVLQDIAAVIMIITVPSLAGGSFPLTQVALAVPAGLLLIAGTYLASTKLLPLVWRTIAHGGSREVSLLAGIVLAIGLAAGSASLGLSIAFGAFLAGLALSENRFGYLTLSDIIPLRELFASVFFVSMGMLIVPEVLWERPLLVAGLVVLVVVGKALVSTLSLSVVGMPVRTAVLSAVLLSQVGEFSFVIANEALQEGVIDQDLASAFLMAAVISILINPALFRLAIEGRQEVESSSAGTLSRHTIICGYDQTSLALARALSGRGIRFVVVDTDPRMLQSESLQTEQVLFGDPVRPEILIGAGLSSAHVLVITSPYARSTSSILSSARAHRPHLAVITAATSPGLSFDPRLVNAVVDPSVEASLEMLRHILQRYGVDDIEIRAQQSQLRDKQTLV